MGESYYQKYHDSVTWQEKIHVMEVFHLHMCLMFPGMWSVTRTAMELDVSVGLACENLQIAELSHIKPDILKCEFRKDAIKFMKVKNDKSKTRRHYDEDDED